MMRMMTATAMMSYLQEYFAKTPEGKRSPAAIAYLAASVAIEWQLSRCWRGGETSPTPLQTVGVINADVTTDRKSVV